jgi:hypothetical protein
MAEQNWTPEPWEVDTVEDGPSGDVIARGMRQVGGSGINKGIEIEMFEEADADRIVACVNAMAGIEDPEEFVRTAKYHKDVLKEV